MLGEFIRYLRAVVLGLRDPLSSFLEPLTMGERYLQWGKEKGDLRDFRAGLDHLRLCPDAYAPQPSLLLRKYACITDLCAGALEQLMSRQEKRAGEAQTLKLERLYEKEVLEKSLKDSRQRAEELRTVGSLLKAKTEDKITHEIGVQLREVNAQLEAAEDLAELCAGYDETVAEANRFLQEMDQADVLIQSCARLRPDIRETMSKQLHEKIETFKKRLDNLDPLKETG